MTIRPALNPQPASEYAHLGQLPDPPRLPDAMQQLPYLTTAFTILDDYFRERPDALVGGEGYLCCDTRDRSRWVAPDCVVAFGVDPGAILHRNGYVIEEVGKPPDFVLEIASESTGRADYTTKRDIYAGYGVGEYWRFDATGGQHHDAALSGERLIDGVYEPMPLQHGQDGVIRGHSPVLGLGLHWDDGRLRFFDPAAGAYLPGLTEAKAQLDAEAEARRNAEIELDAEVEARRNSEVELQRLREQLSRLQSE